ncbi:MAG: beta-propeller domain-containing protein [Thiolinea sp.]
MDEADRFKTDQNYLYAVTLDGLALNIYRPEHGQTPCWSSMMCSWSRDSGDGLYLRPQNSNNWWRWPWKPPASTRLVPEWFNLRHWQQRQTSLLLFDLQQAPLVKERTRIKLEGQLISSRRIGSTLYLVTRHTPFLPGLLPDPNTSQRQAAANRNLIQAATLEDLLPHYQQDQRPRRLTCSAHKMLSGGTPPAAASRQASVISLLAH